MRADQPKCHGALGPPGVLRARDVRGSGLTSVHFLAAGLLQVGPNGRPPRDTPYETLRSSRGLERLRTRGGHPWPLDSDSFRKIAGQ